MFENQSSSAFNVGVEPKMFWMSIECEAAEAAPSLGRAELDELGPGTKVCVIVWLYFRFRSYWCLSDFVCDTCAFTPTEFWLFKSTLVKFTLPHSCGRFRVKLFPELVKCAVINSNQSVGKMPLMFLILKQKTVTTEAVNEHIQDLIKWNLRPTHKIWTYLRLFKTRRNPDRVS